MPKEKYRSKKNIGKALEEIVEGLVVVKNDWQKTINSVNYN
jgi:DNA-directed RNA polymerase subunit K/omega